MDSHRKLIRRYPPITLVKERRLIARAKKGSRQCADEIVLRHLGFVAFRMYKRGFPELVRKYGDDLIAESIPLLYRQVHKYDLNYRDAEARPKPVRFASYIWKRIDGFVVDYFRREKERERREFAEMTLGGG